MRTTSTVWVRFISNRVTRVRCVNHASPCAKCAQLRLKMHTKHWGCAQLAYVIEEGVVVGVVAELDALLAQGLVGVHHVLVHREQPHKPRSVVRVGVPRELVVPAADHVGLLVAHRQRRRHLRLLREH